MKTAGFGFVVPPYLLPKPVPSRRPVPNLPPMQGRAGERPLETETEKGQPGLQNKNDRLRCMLWEAAE